MLLALVVREVEKATKGENGNDDVEHISIGLRVAEFVQVVIDADAGIFKVSPFYGLDVIPFA